MSELLRFRGSLHARPAQAVPTGESMSLRGVEVAPLRGAGEALTEPFVISFEQAGQRLSELPRMFFEPDGSLVWVSAATDPLAWQLDGVLYDREDRLLYVELLGCCPASAWEQLLRACGWPENDVMFQLQREAILLAEADFRRWAAAPETS